ncbi:MAG: DUF3800 domain-containing protein, partial [Actinomycetota bacterium]
VIFDDNLEAEKTAVAIKQIKRDLKFTESTEFKFCKTKQKYRLAFLETIKPFNFAVRSLIVKKSDIRSLELRNNKESFYSYFIKMALKHTNNSIVNASIKIDGSGDRQFRKSFLNYLHRELNDGDMVVVKKCRLVDSKNDVVIQMADMVAGSINRSCYKNKNNCLRYKTIIEGHIKNIWNFK